MSQPTIANNYTDYACLIVVSRSANVYLRANAGTRSVRVSGGLAGYYEGNVIQSATLCEDVGDRPLFRFQWPEFTFTVAREYIDRDTLDDLTSHLNNNYGNTIYVSVYLCDGATCDTTDRIFYGILGEEGIRISASTITFTAQHHLSRYDVKVPASRYSFDKKAGDPDQRGEPIPILYGSYRDRPARFMLPCTITERRTKIVDGSHEVAVQIGRAHV